MLSAGPHPSGGKKPGKLLRGKHGWWEGLAQETPISMTPFAAETSDSPKLTTTIKSFILCLSVSAPGYLHKCSCLSVSEGTESESHHAQALESTAFSRHDHAGKFCHLD